MKDLTLITGNPGKAREFSQLLGFEVRAEKLPLPEIQSTDVEEVAILKAETAYAHLKRPVFVDDTGLYIHAWGQLPGALIAWFLDNVGNEGILRMLHSWDRREATVKTALGYCDSNGARVFTGELPGTIAHSLRGENGFGYDPIFIPKGQGKTFAEMTQEEKNIVSMRAVAARRLHDYWSLARS